MYLRITNTPKGQYLTICEKYRGKTTGKRKDIYVRKIGYASEYASQYSDPIAHFTVCFTALVLIRLLHLKLKKKYPVGQLLESLRRYSRIPISEKDYQFCFYNEVIRECGSAFDISLDRKFQTQQEMRRLLKY